MRILLDTHVFLWYITASPKLDPSLRGAIQDPHNTVFLSSASTWEIIIKHSVGKIPLPEDPYQYVIKRRIAHRILPLPIRENCLKSLADLPKLHSDPFDRLLISQALSNELILMTLDAKVRAYSVPVLPSG